MRPSDIHPACTNECTHQQVPDRGGVIMQCSTEHDRMVKEARLIELFPGKRVAYLGMSAEYDQHLWIVGAKPFKPLPSIERSEGRQAKREIKYEIRREVWTGTGRVDPVDFNRAPEAFPEPYPAPRITSDMAASITPSQPATGVLALARSHGWDGVITHARGCLPHATHGRPTAEKTSEAVRLARGTQRAVAVRMGGSWTSFWTWSDVQFFTRYSTLEAFLTAAFGVVQGCESIPMGWAALTDPIQGCAINDVRFVRVPAWGPVQGCEVPA